MTLPLNDVLLFQGGLNSPPPPLPTGPPPNLTSPKASIITSAGSPVSAGLPSVSPVTPNDSPQAEPQSPPIVSGAYMDEDRGSEEPAGRRVPDGSDLLKQPVLFGTVSDDYDFVSEACNEPCTPSDLCIDVAASLALMYSLNFVVKRLSFRLN